MKRIIFKPIVIGAVMLMVIGGVSMIGAAQQTPNENRTDVAPGERLSGIVGVQNAEITGDLEDRSFGIKIAKAASNDSRADVVKLKLDEIEARLAELADRKKALEQARENDAIRNGTYQARMAVLTAEVKNLNRQLNTSETAAQGLPEEHLTSKGITVESIQTLKHNASNMTGPEVAAVARSIAGPAIGTSIAQNNNPLDIGPPAEVDPGTSQDDDTDTNDTDTRGPPGDAPNLNNEDDDDADDG